MVVYINIKRRLGGCTIEASKRLEKIFSKRIKIKIPGLGVSVFLNKLIERENESEEGDKWREARVDKRNHRYVKKQVLN